jgi:predicted nucleic acid-binding protein
MEYYSIKALYFDASALVKLVADDADETPGRDALREYHRKQAHPGYTTSFCIAESFGAFKLKFLRKKITEAQYIKCIRGLILTTGNTLQVNEVPILSPTVREETERLIATYKLDFIDCFQIVTIMQGEFRIFVGDSQSILITADRELARVARQGGARVWECTSEPAPNWGVLATPVCSISRPTAAACLPMPVRSSSMEACVGSCPGSAGKPHPDQSWGGQATPQY